MNSLYADLLAAGVEISNHESDLYFKDTPEARAILREYPQQLHNARPFTNQAPPHKGETWVDVPFAFLPWWEKRQKREEALGRAHGQGYQPKTGAQV